MRDSFWDLLARDYIRLRDGKTVPAEQPSDESLPTVFPEYEKAVLEHSARCREARALREKYGSEADRMIDGLKEVVGPRDRFGPAAMRNILLALCRDDPAGAGEFVMEARRIDAARAEWSRAYRKLARYGPGRVPEGFDAAEYLWTEHWLFKTAAPADRMPNGYSRNGVLYVIGATSNVSTVCSPEEACCGRYCRVVWLPYRPSALDRAVTKALDSPRGAGVPDRLADAMPGLHDHECEACGRPEHELAYGRLGVFEFAPMSEDSASISQIDVDFFGRPVRKDLDEYDCIVLCPACWAKWRIVYEYLFGWRHSREETGVPVRYFDDFERLFLKLRPHGRDAGADAAFRAERVKFVADAIGLVKDELVKYEKPAGLRAFRLPVFPKRVRMAVDKALYGAGRVSSGARKALDGKLAALDELNASFRARMKPLAYTVCVGGADDGDDPYELLEAYAAAYPDLVLVAAEAVRANMKLAEEYREAYLAVIGRFDGPAGMSRRAVKEASDAQRKKYLHIPRDAYYVVEKDGLPYGMSAAEMAEIVGSGRENP